MSLFDFNTCFFCIAAVRNSNMFTVALNTSRVVFSFACLQTTCSPVLDAVLILSEARGCIAFLLFGVFATALNCDSLTVYHIMHFGPEVKTITMDASPPFSFLVLTVRLIYYLIYFQHLIRGYALQSPYVIFFCNYIINAI